MPFDPFHRGAAFEAFVAPARPRTALWRVVLGLTLFFGLYVAVVGGGAALAALALSPEAVQGGFDLGTRRGVALALGAVAVWIPLLALVLAALHRRRLSGLLGPSRRIDLRAYGRGFAIAMAFGAVTGLIGAALYGAPRLQGLGAGTWALGAVAILPLLALQTGAEELLFRGYLQQQLGARFRTGLAWAVTPSVAFGLLHWSPEGFGGGGTGVIVLAAMLGGLIAAIVTARTGDLSMAMGLHMGVNTFTLLFTAPPGYLSGFALATWPEGALPH